MRYLTADEVEYALDTESIHPVFYMSAGPAMLTIKAACKALADSPCPVCNGSRCIHGHTGLGHGETPKSFTKICTHCRDYPPDRRGKAYRDWQHACDALERKEGEG
jgi:hypothetical protein